MIVSTRADNLAVSVHNSKGLFLASFAYGPAFIRLRMGTSEPLVLPVKLPSPSDGKPLLLSSGHVVQFGTSPINNQTVMRVQNGSGEPSFKVSRETVVVQNNGTLTFLSGQGKHKKPAINTLPPRILSSQADVNALVSLMIDRPGAWTADDDFVGGPGDYPPNIGVVGTTTVSSSKARSGAVHRYDDCSSGSGSSSFLTLSSFDDFNSNDFNSSGSYSGPPNRYAVVRDTTSGGTAHPDLSKECINAGVDIALGLLGSGVSGIGALVDCVTPAGLITFGAGCALAVAAFAISYGGYNWGLKEWYADGCPNP